MRIVSMRVSSPISLRRQSLPSPIVSGWKLLTQPWEQKGLDISCKSTCRSTVSTPCSRYRFSVQPHAARLEHVSSIPCSNSFSIHPSQGKENSYVEALLYGLGIVSSN